MEKISYTITPATLPNSLSAKDIFEELSKTPWALFFDSAGDSAQDNQFDILLHSPAKTIVTYPQHSVVTDRLSGEETILNDDPIEIAQRTHRELLNNVEFKQKELANRLPFLIGIAGMFGYDLGRHFEHLPSPFDTDTNCPDMALGLYDRSLIFDKHNQQLFECRPESSKPFKIKDTAQSFLPFTLTDSWQANTSEQTYLEKLARIRQYLIDGDCYQVNFAQRFSAPYSGDEYLAYRALSEANRAPYSAFMRLESCSILSISPERFLSVKNGHVETKPIKGTRPRSADPTLDKKLAAELLESEKDRAENLMIVDLLRNDISKHCRPNSVNVPSPFALESYAAVHHMVSTVTGELDDDSDPFTLLRDAFPGGSITGAPKIRAMQIIDELEIAPRHIYCGSMGYIGAKNDMDTSICIRTILAENKQLHCWAGGGIVIDSDARDEYQECLDKVNKILPVLL
ncbi:aminodeoxychorismate synthase component I [Alteromonas facilis]|uniref:aminodeoxychorismate synthase component I n=1 Tax=Alteromonas facilis TaxID=2048004 RepID=UPI000C28E9AF|nr:aminodeoxychorismate synthase component I [Alteromonas facilis]